VHPFDDSDFPSFPFYKQKMLDNGAKKGKMLYAKTSYLAESKRIFNNMA